MSVKPPVFTVINPGVLSLLQDQGRFGFHQVGLSNGGPMDADSFYWANRLCSNDEGATVIEITMGGLDIVAQVDTYFAVTGAHISISLNGKPKSLWRCHVIKSGDRLTFGFASKGCRCYLAVAGGFIVNPVFNSMATVPRESIGGLDGKGLKAGDDIACKRAKLNHSWRLAEEYRPNFTGEINLRLLLAYQHDQFSSLQRQHFFEADFQLTNRCDRMGYCLQGPSIQADIDGVLSEGVSYGAVQIPVDGQPIILLNDRQTIGGYPKIGAVISIDIPRLVQATPGTTVKFTAILITDAQLLIRRHHKLRAQTLLQAVG